jgi:uncharacterized protein (UPF0297 family)
MMKKKIKEGSIDMEDLTRTQYIQLTSEELNDAVSVKDVFASVYAALTEKGYNPVNQIVGYIMSGDPTYITSHKGARSMIMKVERDELVEEMLKSYIKNTGWNDK